MGEESRQNNYLSSKAAYGGKILMDRVNADWKTPQTLDGDWFLSRGPRVGQRALVRAAVNKLRAMNLTTLEERRSHNTHTGFIIKLAIGHL